MPGDTAAGSRRPGVNPQPQPYRPGQAQRGCPAGLSRPPRKAHPSAARAGAGPLPGPGRQPQPSPARTAASARHVSACGPGQERERWLPGSRCNPASAQRAEGAAPLRLPPPRPAPFSRGSRAPVIAVGTRKTSTSSAERLSLQASATNRRVKHLHPHRSGSLRRPSSPQPCPQPPSRPGWPACPAAPPKRDTFAAGSILERPVPASPRRPAG